MNETLELLTKNEVTTAGIIFLMIFSCFVALFHTVIFSGLFKAKFNGWLFFVVNPLLILLSSLIYRPITYVMFGLLFISVFILAIIGMIYAGISGVKKARVEQDKINKKYDIEATPIWKKLLGYLAVLVVIIAFYYVGFYAIFFLIFAIPFLNFILPNTKSRFLKYQSTLPTSKIRSVAMGLAEIEGKLRTIEHLESPIDAIPCIGYRYKIEKISTDKDGDKSYSSIFDEIKCNPFYVLDETGIIKVIPDKIEFVYVPEYDSYIGSGKRYTQYLLQENDSMLLIGKASLQANNEPIFEYENIKKVFAIAPSEKVNHYNTFKPLLNSFTLFCSFFGFLVAVVLVTPIEITTHKISISEPQFFDSNETESIYEIEYDSAAETDGSYEENEDFNPQRANDPYNSPYQDAIPNN
ncbi:hypothetical protein I2486_17315 [Cellulophaga sp. E16_2]|uniref:hypothetical protein n=1 Tax=Cellulophaga sp. E16_2 TaxID=2789297 RepID=UPI001A92881A|nr:hypothetical protein [Cellulophaga sp. E16_2]MBO0593165.1 hypothetical protein [Cellulophaga sp. E16_2]